MHLLRREVGEDGAHPLVFGLAGLLPAGLITAMRAVRSKTKPGGGQERKSRREEKRALREKQRGDREPKTRLKGKPGCPLSHLVVEVAPVPAGPLLSPLAPLLPAPGPPALLIILRRSGSRSRSPAAASAAGGGGGGEAAPAPAAAAATATPAAAPGARDLWRLPVGQGRKGKVRGRRCLCLSRRGTEVGEREWLSPVRGGAKRERRRRNRGGPEGKQSGPKR